MMSSSLVRATRHYAINSGSRRYWLSKISSNRRGFMQASYYSQKSFRNDDSTLRWAVVIGATSAFGVAAMASTSSTAATTAECSAGGDSTGRVPLGTGIIGGKIVKEKATGISFPDLVNGMKLVGCGVRIKYAFVKVYAVGTYMDPFAMSAVKSRPKAEIEQALLEPSYPRVIRIVLNRELTAEQFTSAVIEALEPRMHGQDLWALDDFRKMNPSVTLPKGSQVLMTIRGDLLLYESPSGQFGQIKSETFTKAMCDVYYGADPVSPTHKAAVVDGIPKTM